MPIDRQAAAQASDWGRATARKLAQTLGASLPSGNSNECTWEGQRIVIKCAAPKTTSVGVTYKMLDRLATVVGAFQVDGASFDIWTLPAADFRAHMRPTRSRGASSGKVGIVTRETFYLKGKSLGRFSL